MLIDISGMFAISWKPFTMSHSIERLWLLTIMKALLLLQKPVDCEVGTHDALK